MGASAERGLRRSSAADQQHSRLVTRRRKRGGLASLRVHKKTRRGVKPGQHRRSCEQGVGGERVSRVTWGGGGL